MGLLIVDLSLDPINVILSARRKVRVCLDMPRRNALGIVGLVLRY